MILNAQNKPSSNIYFENLCNDYDIDWTAIYMLSRLATYSTYMQSFQYKILKNVLFLNKKLHIFGIKPSLLCFFCNLCDETTYHICYECDRVKFLWSDLVQCFQNNLILPNLTPLTAISVFLDFANNYSIFENNKVRSNHILLIFKLDVWKSREKKLINISNLLPQILKVKRTEKEIDLNNSKKIITSTKKWHIINNIVP